MKLSGLRVFFLSCKVLQVFNWLNDNKAALYSYLDHVFFHQFLIEIKVDFPRLINVPTVKISSGKEIDGVNDKRVQVSCY